MCGICGIIQKDGAKVFPNVLSALCKTIVHRGPDDEGVYAFESFGIGMRRLKIIDLATGHQPIHNEDKTKWIVFNGEIYNYQEIKNTLIGLGHVFYTKSDTEVILHSYEQYGEKCVDHLNGMFCFAVLDIREKKVFIARDRLGIKQLYYYEDDKKIVFGSEIKVILESINKHQPLNYKAIDDYFSFLYVPFDKTIFANIKKLPPAHVLIIKDNKLITQKYWSLNYGSLDISEKEAIDLTENKINRAIQLQMISDVPLGAFLSGGIDSSLIVAMMSGFTNHPVETFSITWDNNSFAYDEREYSRMVSQMYHTNHHEFLVKPDIEEVMNGIVESFDEPFADASAIPNYYLSRETRKFVTVALSGLGGDEIAAGYERYLGMKLSRYYNIIPGFLRTGLIKNIVDGIPDSKSGYNWSERLKKFVHSAEYDFVKRYYSIITNFENNEKRALYSGQMMEKISGEFNSMDYFKKNIAECNSNNFLNRQLFIDMNTYMVDDLLVLSDRMSMAHSLEMRVPYLDHTLVEHFAQIDPNMKLHKFSKKYILKKIAEKYVPKKLIYRKKKGFSVPLVLWFRGPMKEYMLSILNEKSIEKIGLFNASAVKSIVNQHISGERNNDEKIWSIMMFLLWYDKFVDKIY